MSDPDKLLLIFEMDVLEAESADDVDRRLRELMERAGELGIQGASVHACVRETAEYVLDALQPAQSGGGRHIVLAGPDGWVMEHSLVCRKAGLLECPMNEAVRLAFEEGHLERDSGRWRIWRDESGAVLWDDEL